jgi:hypothetical protein
VLDALEGGASSVADICARTALPRDVVTGAVDHLVRLGRLDVERLPAGCPTGGCGSCATGRSAGSCAQGGPSSNPTGPVLVTITVR